MKVLLGILFIIAVKKGNHTNALEMWSNDGTGLMLLRAAFRYKRFLFLLRSLRFDDIRTRLIRQESGKLDAIREFFSIFLQNCKENYNLGEFITIDKMLHPFRGLKHFISATLKIYCGKQKDGAYLVSNTPTDMVKRLVDPVENSNRNTTTTTDNYYTTHPLGQYLLDRGLTLTSTLKRNKRELPAEFLPHKNHEMNSAYFGFQEDFTIVSYCLKKDTFSLKPWFCITGRPHERKRTSKNASKGCATVSCEVKRGNRGVHKLEEHFEKQGMILKKEEIWISKRLFEYGKRRWLSGVPVAQGTKCAMRLVSEEHDGAPMYDINRNRKNSQC
nr:unnamed protein product [Callosobruchus analis]